MFHRSITACSLTCLRHSPEYLTWLPHSVPIHVQDIHCFNFFCFLLCFVFWSEEKESSPSLPLLASISGGSLLFCCGYSFLCFFEMPLLQDEVPAFLLNHTERFLLCLLSAFLVSFHCAPLSALWWTAIFRTMSLLE